MAENTKVSSTSKSKAANSSDDIIMGSAPKGMIQEFELHTYKDTTYYAHIAKVLLVILIVIGIAAFVIIGFFYPECNSTQDRGFYSCTCKEGSALDLQTGLCMCLDTAATSASIGCANYAANELRYVYADKTDETDLESEYGNWTQSGGTC